MKRVKDFNSFRLYEFEERTKLPNPDQITFMDKVYQRVKDEIVPTIPKEFKLDYNRGKEISLHTDNKKDLQMGVKIVDDKMVIYVRPIDEPMFDINITFDSEKDNYVINTFKSAFEESESNGIFTGVEKVRDFPGYREDDDDDDDDDTDRENIDIPITDKPKRIKRSIEIKIIKSILEDAYILDDIDLKNVTIDELIRRMLVESRKK